MGRFAEGTIEALKEKADIVEVVSEYVRLRPVGRNFVGLCPFHNERTPSFTVSRERGFFHCFGCGIGGTVFTFLMRIEGMSFPEAVKTLARRYGIEIRLEQSDDPRAREREALYRANNFAHEFFIHTLWNSEEGKAALRYLESRGLEASTIREFKLGLAPRGPAALASLLRKNGLFDVGLKAGLVRDSGRGEPLDFFRSRIIFPIYDTQGRVIAFGGRLLEQSSEAPKYLNSPESPIFAKSRALFGLYQARRSMVDKDRALIVEGYVDVMAMWQAGFQETVATLGTALSIDHLKTISRFTRNVIACFDGDQAGRNASLRAVELFLKAGLLGRGIFLPQGLDPDELLSRYGASKLNELLGEARLLVDYFVENERDRAGGLVERKAQAAKRVAEILRMVTDPFEFDLLARRAAQLLDVSEYELRRYAQKTASKSKGNPTVSTRDTPDAALQAQLGLLAAALNFPELRTSIAESISAPEFDRLELVPLIREVCASEGHSNEFSAIIETRLSDAQKNFLGKLLVDPVLAESVSETRRMVKDWFAAITRKVKEEAIQELNEQVKDVQSQGDHLTAAQKAQALIELARMVKTPRES